MTSMLVFFAIALANAAPAPPPSPAKTPAPVTVSFGHHRLEEMRFGSAVVDETREPLLTYVGSDSRKTSRVITESFRRRHLRALKPLLKKLTPAEPAAPCASVLAVREGGAPAETYCLDRADTLTLTRLSDWIRKTQKIAGVRALMAR